MRHDKETRDIFEGKKRMVRNKNSEIYQEIKTWENIITLGPIYPHYIIIFFHVQDYTNLLSIHILTPQPPL